MKSIVWRNSEVLSKHVTRPTVDGTIGFGIVAMVFIL